MHEKKMLGGTCCPDPVPPPNPPSKNLVNTLRIILYIELGCTLLESCCGLFSYGLMELISCLILYQGYTQLSFCNMVMYIFFVGINFVQLLVGFATYIQNLGQQSITWNFANVVSLFLLAFYVVAIYFAFQAYKEFKGLAVDGALGYGGGMSGFGGMGGYGSQGMNAGGQPQAPLVTGMNNNTMNTSNASPSNDRPPQTMQGQGVVLGGTTMSARDRWANYPDNA